MKRRQYGKDLAFFGLILILLLVMLYSGLRILESTVFYEEATPQHTTKTIVRDGTAYFPRQDMTVVLVMGVDREGPAVDSGAHINRASADMAVLLIFDEKNGACDILQLNRDTMVNMPVLGLGGRPAGTAWAQLALAHTYGSGLEDSCVNVRQTVSQLLYGVQIDYYLSMSMDVIPILNDAVGGVTVDVTEDFSQVDPTIGQGSVTLRGQQALNYVRTRKDLGDQLNISRMERHRKYMNGFLTALREKAEQDPGFLLTAYAQVEPYLVTDCSLNAISGMMDRFSDYEIRELITLPGKNVLGETYFEFHLNAEELDALILRLLYAPKK